MHRLELCCSAVAAVIATPAPSRADDAEERAAALVARFHCTVARDEGRPGRSSWRACATPA